MISRLRTLLVTLLLIVSLAGCYEDYSSHKNNFDVSAVEAHSMIQDNASNPDLVIVDVRSVSEFEKEHIKNAVLIPHNSPDLDNILSGMEKEKTYLVYCLIGGRSRSVTNKMRELGFENVYNLDGGIKGWKNKGFDVITE